MNKKYILQKSEDIQKIIKKGNKRVLNYFIVYMNKNNLNKNRFCVSVSKKIGIAVLRNKYKRRIKDILMKNMLNNSTDYVIILRKEILESSYKQMQDELVKFLKGE